MVTLRFAVPAILATAAAAGCFSYFVVTLIRELRSFPPKRALRPLRVKCVLAHDMRDFFRAAAERPLIWINSLTLGGVQVVQAPENGTLQ